MIEERSEESISPVVVQALAGIPRPTLNWLAARLPVTESPKAGAKRRWTTLDVITVMFATKFGEGLPSPLALRMASAARPLLEDILVSSETMPDRPYFLVAQLSGDQAISITNDADEFISVMVPHRDDEMGLAVFNLSAMLLTAFRRLLEHQRAKQKDATVGD